MALALSGLSGLSGIIDGAASVNPDPGLGDLYWRDGLPYDQMRNGNAGADLYWRDGLPSVQLITQ